MNYLNKNTPEGTRDLLYSEAELYDDLTRLFSKNYEMSGFRKVETPVIENYDLITAIDRSINQENLYKLTDQYRPSSRSPSGQYDADRSDRGDEAQERGAAAEAVLQSEYLPDQHGLFRETQRNIAERHRAYRRIWSES